MQRVDSVKGSVLSIQSGYTVADYWSKHSTHSRRAINVIYELYKFNPELFFITPDSIEFSYPDLTSAVISTPKRELEHD